MGKLIFVILVFGTLTTNASAGAMYEWRDPQTGRLQLGDKPPGGGIEYWEEGKHGQVVVKREARLGTPDEGDTCLTYAKAKAHYKDTESARIEGEILYSPQDNGGYEIIIYVNAKNSYGAYAGAKMVRCVYRATGNLDDVILH